MARKSFLRLTRLEDRTTPAVFGSPWADGRTLTLSFVPDGTLVDGTTSSLFQTLNAQAPGWQTEILRAVQTWAQVTNVNVDVVADGGQELGAPGATQGDAHFGDIRIAARPLSDNVLAITTPSGVLGGTRTGDIVLNSTKIFSVGGIGGYDLYSAVLQEIGHALGVGNSTDPNSVMFPQYLGVRSVLTSADVTNIQALYGARAGDLLEGSGAQTNDTVLLARELKRPGGSAPNASIVAVADVSSATDVDYYRVRTQASNTYGLTFWLDGSQSLLAPRMTIYGPDGTTVLGTVQSVNPQTGTLTVSLPSVQANAYYYVKVEDANPTFGVGTYLLKVVFDPNAPDAVADGAVQRIDDAHTDDTLDSAAQLLTTKGYKRATHYSVVGVVRDVTDADVYEIRSPQVSRNEQNVLTINVRGLAALDPAVSVYDKDGRLLTAQVLVNDTGSYVIQVDAGSDVKYFIRVAAESGGGTGEYQLDVDFRTRVINLQDFDSGSLTSPTATSYATLTTARSQLMHLVLSSGETAGTSRAGVRMSIFDLQGNVLATLFAEAGQTISASTYLSAGSYTVRFEGLTPTGSALPGLTYSLRGTTLTDPISPTPADPNAPVNDYTWQKFQDDYYASLVYDPAWDVAW